MSSQDNQTPSGHQAGDNRPGHFYQKKDDAPAPVIGKKAKSLVAKSTKDPATDVDTTSKTPQAPWAPPPPPPPPAEIAATAPTDEQGDTTMEGADATAAGAVNPVIVNPAVAVSNPFGVFNQELESHTKKRRKFDQADDEAVEVKYKVLDQLPLDLQFNEPPHLYPEFLDIDKEKNFSLNTVHSGRSAYRGVDRPSFTTGAKGNTKIGVSGVPAMIYIRDPEGMGLTFGWASRNYPNELGADPRFTKVAFRTDTQRPSTAIIIKLSESQSATYEIFANSLWRNEKSVGLAFKAGPDPGIPDGLPVNPAAGKKVSVVDDAKKIDGEKKKLHKQLAPGEVFDEKFIVVQKGSKDEGELTRRHAVQELAKAQTLWKTDMVLNPSGGQPNSGATGRPRWAGITTQQIKNLERKFEKNEDMTLAEELVVRLNMATELSIYQEFWKDSRADLTPFFQHMLSTSYASANLGNFWWYNLAFPGGDTTSGNYPFSKVPIPRWMVTKWRVRYENSMPVSAEPAGCVSFRHVETGIFPDAATFAFENRLGTAREAHHVTLALERMADSSEVTIFARFRTNVEHNYVAHMRFSRRDSSVARLAVPEVGTKVEIAATVGGRALRLVGTIIHDPYPSGADFAAFVSTDMANAPQIADRDEEFRVTVEYPYDPTAVNRCLNAVESLQRGQIRTEGAYIPEFTLGAPRPDGIVPGYLNRLFQRSPQKKAAFLGEIARHSLNRSQLEAVNLIRRYDTDLACIMGPPGTGKTKAMAALIMGLLAAGCTILVCAASNNAVDNIAEELHKIGRLPGDLDDLCWVRYTSALARTKPGSTGEDVAAEATSGTVSVEPGRYIGFWSDEIEKGLEDAEKKHDALFFTQIMLEARTTASKMAERFGYAHKKLRFVKRCAGPVTIDDEGHYVEDIFGDGPSDHKDKNRAMHFLEVLQRLADARQARQKGAKADRYAFYELDEFFSKLYLKEVVKIVLCTPSMACKEPLIDHFEPDVFALDEAGQSSPPVTMIPLAAFKEHIKAVVLGGDYKQLNPVVVSKSAGESREVLSRSLFANLVNDPHRRYPMVMLDVQYRMDPVLSLFPREQIYAQIGELNDDASVKEPSDTQNAVRKLLQPLRNSEVWNGRVRMAINCEGHSVVPQDSTSPQNESEANQAASIAVGLVISGIDPEKILIISPYLGQRRLIRSKLHGQSSEAASRVKLASAHKVQGEEAEIVILSLVQNDKDDGNKIGFIHEEDQVTVEITRAKAFLFVLGNIGGWMEIIKANNRNDLLMTRDYKLFRKFIQDCHDRGDVINARDWDSVMVRHERLEVGTYYSGVFAKPPAPKKQGGQHRSNRDTKASEFSQRDEAPAEGLGKMRLGDGKGKGKPGGKPNTHGGRGKPPGTGKKASGSGS